MKYELNEFCKHYFVSKYGFIYSNKSGKLKQLKPELLNGYQRVTIYNNNIRHKVLIHVLVSQTFISNPENKPQVNHINGIRHDNRVENLEWCTNGENLKHAYSKLNRVLPNRKLSNKDIINIRSSNDNCKTLSKKYKVSHSTISEILKNKRYKYVK